MKLEDFLEIAPRVMIKIFLGEREVDRATMPYDISYSYYNYEVLNVEFEKNYLKVKLKQSSSIVTVEELFEVLNLENFNSVTFTRHHSKEVYKFNFFFDPRICDFYSYKLYSFAIDERDLNIEYE